ncbi:MAG: hypothetical protein JXR41_01650, partial [Bacteroidales bacterium]|nr:hypothetical protein [Bacteroidales bacterium]
MDSKRIFVGHIIFISLFALSVFLFFLLFIRPEFYFFAQQPPFQTNIYFIMPYLSFPGGISYYLSHLIMQFFTINWLGSLIITFILLTLLFLISGIFRGLRRPGMEWIIIFLPVTLLLGLFTNFYFPLVTALNIIFVYAALYLSTYFFNSGHAHWTLYFLSAPVLYYTCGGSSLILYSAGFLILLFFRLPDLKKAIIPAFTVIAFCLAMPYLSYKVLFHVTMSKAFFEYYPTDSLLIVNYKKGVFFYLFFYSVPALLLLNESLVKLRSRKSMASKEKPKKVKVQRSNGQSGPSWIQKKSILIVYTLITLLAMVLVKVNYTPLDNKIVKANYYCTQKMWDAVLDIVRSEKDYDVNLNYFYNRAIDNTDQYLDKYFDYPQFIGHAATNPEIGDFGLLYMYWSDYFYDLGHIPESERWALKALVGFPYCPRILERLVKINMVLGKYNAAEKLLVILDDNLISGRFVKKYTAMIEDTSLVYSDEEIMAKRAEMPVNIITPKNVTFRYNDLVNRNKNNRRAYEHMQMNLLL